MTIPRFPFGPLGQEDPPLGSQEPEEGLDSGDELPAAAPAAPPPPSDPQPFQGVAAVVMRCEICGGAISVGSFYVQGAERGPAHPEPCSHQAN